MLVNIASNDLREFHLHTEPDLTDTEVIGALRSLGFANIVETEDAGFFVGAEGAYTRGGQRHIVRMTAQSDGDDSPFISVWYRRAMPEQVARPPNDIKKIREALMRLRATSEVTGFAGWLLDDDWRPLVSLPMIVVRSPGAGFDEIRGVRIVKTHEGEVVESTVLDSRENGLSVSASVTFNTTLSPNTPVETLKRLNNLRARMVFPVKEVQG